MYEFVVPIRLTIMDQMAHVAREQGKSAACSLSDISGWRDGVLYPLTGGGRRLRRGADRPARAAWAVQRLLAARW